MTERNYRFDNIKGILIFLVVFCHFLELFGGIFKYRLYLLVYAFHMPCFVFVSGYFSKLKTENVFFKQILPYLAFQWIYCVCMGKALDFVTPAWIMWYLFSMIFWTLLSPVVQKKPAWAFGVSVIAGLLAGYITPIGYVGGLSRTICLFPFYVAGIVARTGLSPSMPKDEQSARKRILLEKTTGGILLLFAVLVTIFLIPYLKTNWLYYAVSYAESDCTLFYRLLLYINAFMYIISMYLMMPYRPLKVVSTIGKNCLHVYLFHGIIVLWCKKIQLFGFSQTGNMALSMGLAVLLTACLGSDAIKRVLRYVTDYTWLNALIEWKIATNEKKQKVWHLVVTAAVCIFLMGWSISCFKMLAIC